MSLFAWINAARCGRKTNEAAVATNELRPLDIRTCEGGPNMPFGYYYGDSTPFFKAEQSVNGAHQIGGAS